MNADFDLKHLRHFVLLAEELSFTRASERANLSQTAFSRSIQALEAGLGVRTFDRGTRSVRLTSAGRTLLTRARKMLSQATDLAHEVQGLAEASHGTLSFGASLMAIDGALKGLLPKLRALSPHLRVEVSVGNSRMLKAQLDQEQIEFFVGYPGPFARDPEYSIIALAPEASSVYCRPMHPLATSVTAPTPEQLLEFPWASVKIADNLTARRRALLHMTPDVPLPELLTCDSQTLLREAVLGNDMLMFTWGSWLRADVHRRAVIDLGSRLQPRLPRELMLIDCAIAQLAGRTLLPAAQRLIGMILNAGAKAPI